MRRRFFRNRLMKRERGFNSPVAIASLRGVAASLLLLSLLTASTRVMAQSCPSNNCPGIIPLIAFGDLDIGCESVFSTQYSQCLSGVGGAVIGGTACCAAQFDTNLCACPPANYAAPPGPKVGGGPTCGEPVDAGTGLFTYNHTDLKLSDTIPILLTRSYRELDTVSRAFGVGMTHNYDLILVLDPSGENAYIDLILPDRAVVHYPRISPGTDIPTAVFEHTSSPSIYFGSTIKWNTDGWTLTLKNGTQMVFWLSRLVSITDRNSNTVQLQLDSDFNVTQITSPNGRWISLAYDSNDRVERAQDNTGRTTYYVYSSSGHLTKAYDAAGHATLYSYDSAGLMQSFTTPNGNVHVTNQYDSNSRVVKQTQADGGVFNFTYSLDGNGNVTETDMVDPRGYTCQMAFNSNGYLTSDVEAVGEPEQQQITYSRDSNTNLLNSITDALSRTTAYSYDSLANVISITRLSGTSSEVTTSFTYDTTFSQMTSVTDELGHTWTLGLDNNGNVTGITNPLGHHTTATRNAAGQIQSVTSAAEDTVSLGYTNGIISSISDALGNSTKFAVDGAGRIVGVTDPLGNPTSVVYDVLSRIVQIVEANGAVTSFGHDADGNLITLTDANGGITTYAYDAMDRQASRTDPLGGIEVYSFDDNNNLVQFVDRRGTVRAYNYDGLNRPVFVGFGQSGSGYESSISYDWDAGNRLTQAVDSIAGTIVRTYDGLDNLTEELTPQGEVSYSYNASQRASMRVAGQNVISYTWDNAHRLTGITQGTAAVGISYDTANRRTSLTLPNGVNIGYSFDNDSRITGLTYTAGSSQLGNLTYVYDVDGRVIGKGGSLAATTLPSAISGNTYNAANEMLNFGGQALTYDANGNLTNDGVNTYTWDARNQMSAISGGTNAGFIYDGFGRRTSKTVGQNTTQYIYDWLNPVQEIQGGALSASLLTGLRPDEYFFRSDSEGNVSSVLTDALGSTIGLVGSTQTVATSYNYGPFGSTASGGASSTNSYQFTGRENDGTGLFEYRSRYYDSSLQRFVSQDPIGFAGGDSNLYAYVRNEPTNHRDPTGQVIGIDDVIIGVLIASLTGAVYEWLQTDPCASGTQQMLNAGKGATIGAVVGVAPYAAVSMAAAAGGTAVGAEAISASTSILLGALSGGAAGAAESIADAAAEAGAWDSTLPPFLGPAIGIGKEALDQASNAGGSGSKACSGGNPSSNPSNPSPDPNCLPGMACGCPPP